MQGMEEIAALLHIHEKAAAHGGNLNNIAGAALAELRQINADMGKASEPPPHSLPGEPPRPEPPAGAEVPTAEGTSDESPPTTEPKPTVGTVTVGGQNG